MIGFEIIISTGVIVSFILGWTKKIIVDPIKKNQKEILEKLNQEHDLIKRQVIGSEPNNEKFINELINLWNFQYIKQKFENDIVYTIHLLDRMFYVGLFALSISCFYVGLKNNMFSIDFLPIETTISVSFIINFFVISLLFSMPLLQRNVKKKVDLFMEGSKISDIYSVEDVFRG